MPIETYQQISITKIRQHISNGFMGHDSLRDSFNFLLSTVSSAHFSYYRDSIAMLLSDIKRFNDDCHLGTFYQADLIKKGKNLIKECQSDLEVYCGTPDDPGYNFYDSCKKIADYYKEVDESKEFFDKEWRVAIKNTLGSGQDYDALMKCIEMLEQNVPPKTLTELVELKTALNPTSPVRIRAMVKELILDIVNS